MLVDFFKNFVLPKQIQLLKQLYSNLSKTTKNLSLEETKKLQFDFY